MAKPPPGKDSRAASTAARAASTRGAPAAPKPVAEGYLEVTGDICVSVRAFFLEDQSRPEENRFVWAYRVRIENRGRRTVQLLRRTWRITDAHGRTQMVRGEGVVGEQPVLEPDEAFEYTSGTPLETPSGFMTGTYHMVDAASGEAFDVAIPNFSLDSPHWQHRMH
jgi:ApaG protein